MIPFIGLGTYVRALFLTILFVEVCISSCLTIWSFMQKNLLPKIISPVSAISALLFILPYSAYIFAENNGVSVNAYSFVEKLLGLDGKEQIEEYGLAPFIDKCKDVSLNER